MMQDAATTRPEISVVIPCYNEEGNVREIHAAVLAELTTHARSFEIIIIDNASTDRTREYARELCAQHSCTRAIFNNRNYGQMRSPTYAIYQAEGEAVIGMCADFQDPPALIGPMIAQWRAGAEVVLGQRRVERAGLGKRLSRVAGYALLGRFADYPVIPNATGFGLYCRTCVDALAAWHEPEPFFRGMVVESGFRIALIAYDRPERAAGETKNDFRQLANFALSGLSGSAKSLLRAPLMLSVYMALATLLLLFVAVPLVWLAGGPVWLAGLAGLQLGLSALLLFFIGMVGDQVRLVSERTRNVPLVLEAERLNFPVDRQRPAARTAVIAPV
jgi:glycosyltransferase involved in cell wall biosynthesis